MKTDNALLIIALIAVVVSVAGAGITYNYINAFKNKWPTGFATGTVNLTVESAASINFTTDEINWGSGRVNTGVDNATLSTAGGANNITNGNWTGNTAGFVIENIGNENVTLEIATGKTAATFISGTAGGGPSYRFNVSDNTEDGSCEYNVTEGDWNVVNTTSPGTLVCRPLYAADATDVVRIDVEVVIPSDSLIGELTDTFTATIAAI